MKLDVHQIVNTYEKSLVEIESCKNRENDILEDIKNAKATIRRKTLQLELLEKSLTNAKGNLKHNTNMINKLRPHYGEAKSSVKKLESLKKAIEKTEALQARRRKVINTIKSL